MDMQKTNLNDANYYTIVTQIAGISNITVVILSTTILYDYAILLSNTYIIMMILFNI